MSKQTLIVLSIIIFLSNCNILPQTILEVNPGFNQIILPNQTVVQLKLENAVNLYTASVTISFDQNVINYSGVVIGNVLTGNVFVNNNSNSITVDLSNINLNQFTGNGVLFSITFNSVGLGTSPVTISDVKLRNNNNNPLTTDIVSGLIGVSNPIGLKVNVKVLLQGPYNGTGMNTNLNNYGYLPFSQPYSAEPFNYQGTEKVAADFFQNHSNVVDWILIEIRNDISSSDIIGRRVGFLLNNGLIVDTNGINPVAFSDIVQGYYFIVIRHRNHLAVMSAAPVSLTTGSSVYDFTTSQTKAFNFSFNPMSHLADGTYGLYAGDANANGTVDASDINLFWRPNNGTAYDYSKSADFNLDGSIDARDINLYWRLNNSVSTQVP